MCWASLNLSSPRNISRKTVACMRSLREQPGVRTCETSWNISSVVMGSHEDFFPEHRCRSAAFLRILLRGKASTGDLKPAREKKQFIAALAVRTVWGPSLFSSAWLNSSARYQDTTSPVLENGSKPVGRSQSSNLFHAR